VRKSLAISAGVTLAVLLTHGMVYSGIHLDPSKPLPPSTYQGFFDNILLSIWNLWRRVHGWEPISHVEEFGSFYGHAVLLVCPLLGFGVFALASQQKVSWQLWKPLAIAAAFATPLQQGIRHGLMAAGLDEALVEAGRAAIVFLLMAWSIGAIRIPKWRRPESSRQSATV
jgi:hypothetical protein